MRFWKSIVVFLLIIAAIIFGIRMFTPEDTWLCQDGAWKRHGNPKATMPTEVCPTKPTTNSNK